MSHESMSYPHSQWKRRIALKVFLIHSKFSEGSILNVIDIPTQQVLTASDENNPIMEWQGRLGSSGQLDADPNAANSTLETPKSIAMEQEFNTSSLETSPSLSISSGWKSRRRMSHSEKLCYQGIINAEIIAGSDELWTKFLHRINSLLSYSVGD